MPDYNDQDLDLSIVQIDLNTGLSEQEMPKSGFWQSVGIDEHMALAVRKLPKDVHVEHPICHDYVAFVDKIAEIHAMELASGAEPINAEPPNELDDQLAECTPQFILRNIPKIEHYYDLERPLYFDFEEMPRGEAEDLIHEARSAKIGKVDFIPVESSEFINDFRAFLEEIFVLCPWDQITRQSPPEGNPWHISHSTSKLALDLLSKKNTLFIFSEKGLTTVGMKEYKPKTEKSDFQDGGSGRVHTYGPG